VATVPLGNGENVTMSIWDLNNAERFKFMHPTFLKGAAAYVLFYNASLPHSIDLVEYWLRKIMKTRSNPLICIIEDQLEDHTSAGNVIFDEIVEDLQLEDIVFISLLNREERILVFNRIAERIFENSGISPFFTLTDREKIFYVEFIQTFSTCPVCGENNHKNYLDRIYFATNKKSRRIKESLLDLLEMKEDLIYEFRNEIHFGIPCCACFKKYYPNEN
jgi:hypothetical protein